ncbi:MAG: Na(+)/H(+) antiporter subunit D, partial [Gemmatimonadetes bacterium]|nr:Na(+)/H(+) antiporter subunit D [Gemmatimonadota bacterium]
MGSLPPFVPFFLGALLVPFVRGVPRTLLLLLIPVVGGLNLAGLEMGQVLSADLLGYALMPLRVDRLSMLFGILFHIAAFIGLVYALHLKREDHDTVQHVSAVLYAGSALGAVFAGDLITLFVFWELLALTSVFLIWTRRKDSAVASGMRYLIIQVLSGVTLLAGIIVYAHDTGSIAFDFIGAESLGGKLILLGIGVKAAFPLLHTWLTESYPEGTATGTVFLSAFTTKVAVYTLARGFPGTESLVWIGAVMACYPIFFAVIENDLRKVLSYSMMNQIGFMVVGVGLGTSLSINGAVAHAFNDVLFKG